MQNKAGTHLGKPGQSSVSTGAPAIPHGMLVVKLAFSQIWEPCINSKLVRLSHPPPIVLSKNTRPAFAILAIEGVVFMIIMADRVYYYIS